MQLSTTEPQFRLKPVITDKDDMQYILQERQTFFGFPMWVTVFNGSNTKMIGTPDELQEYANHLSKNIYLY